MQSLIRITSVASPAVSAAASRTLPRSVARPSERLDLRDLVVERDHRVVGPAGGGELGQRGGDRGGEHQLAADHRAGVVDQDHVVAPVVGAGLDVQVVVLQRAVVGQVGLERGVKRQRAGPVLRPRA
jgi:hypothetical protein